MDVIEAEDLLSLVEMLPRHPKGRVYRLSNGEHVVRLAFHDYFLWSPECWYAYQQRRENNLRRTQTKKARHTTEIARDARDEQARAIYEQVLAPA